MLLGTKILNAVVLLISDAYILYLIQKVLSFIHSEAVAQYYEALNSPFFLFCTLHFMIAYFFQSSHFVYDVNLFVQNSHYNYITSFRGCIIIKHFNVNNDIIGSVGFGAWISSS